MSVTLQNVAREAGVSITTVHRVLKEKGDVSKETIESVQRVIKELGYQDPSISKAERFGGQKEYGENCFRTGNIGLLLLGYPIELLKVPMHVHLLGQLETALSRHGLFLTIIQVPDQKQLSPMVNTERLDGVLMIGEPSGREMRNQLQAMHAVGIGGSMAYDEHWTDSVTSDYYARGRMAVKYLVNRGHKRIAFFNSIPSHAGFIEVDIAFQSAARRLGVECIDLNQGQQNCKPGAWRSGPGETIIEELIDNIFKMPADYRPTGIHAANDEIAMGIYKELGKRGMEAGRDLDIISCGNEEEYLGNLHPRPATMDINIEEFANRAVDKLIYRIKNPGALAGIRVLVPQSIVEGEISRPELQLEFCKS